ncbi:MAG: hypothetical protein ABI766_04925 [Gemmatimonadales bacterium]
MTDRFLCSDPEAGDLSFADVESILDALEAALVSADTPLFDGVRQSWQPVGAHPEVRSAWVARERFRPPGGTGLMLPQLPALVAMEEEDDIAVRRAAYARMRREPGPEPIASRPRGERKVAAAAVLCAALLLALVGWVVVTFAMRLGQVAGVMVRVGK